MPCCQYCGRRFLSEGLPGCPYCRKPPAPNGPHPFVRAHLYKVDGVWLVGVKGYFLTRLAPEPKRRQGLEDCVRLAAIWNVNNNFLEV